MIPKICANCAQGSNVGNQEQIIGTVCKATPLSLWKDPQDTCGAFSMADSPVYSVPDEVPEEGANMPSEAFSEALKAIGGEDGES